MKIYSSSEVLRSDQAREVQRSNLNRQKNSTQPASPSGRSDKVQISDAGRALAAQVAEGAGGDLTPERITEIRDRILSGAYNSLEVVDQVARKMLESGDI